MPGNETREVGLVLDGETHEGILGLPERPSGLVIFAHGSGSSRLSPRNRRVAGALHDAGFATLLFDLLTEAEDRVFENRFDIELLTRRLVAAAEWAARQPALAELPRGYFGASTGAAAALKAAARQPGRIAAVVSRGGRPDLAGAELEAVEAPVLLVVGGHDPVVIDLNRQALDHLQADSELEIVPGATHLFQEPGSLEQVARLAGDWFRRWLARAAARSIPRGV